jgi:hypothetical protein
MIVSRELLLSATSSLSPWLISIETSSAIASSNLLSTRVVKGKVCLIQVGLMAKGFCTPYTQTHEEV